MVSPKSYPAASRKSESLWWRIFRVTKLGDYVVALCFILLCSVSLWLPRALSGKPSGIAQVLINDRRVMNLDLDSSGTTVVQGRLGLLTIGFGSGKVRVLASSCPNQFCVRQGAIQYHRQMLVCVPNHVVILIPAAAQSDLDAVTF